MLKLLTHTSLLALLIAGLPGCWFCAKKCKQQSPVETECAKEETKRISGPLSDPDITWTEEDFK